MSSYLFGAGDGNSLHAFMYFIVYDVNDFIVCYLDNISDLCNFSGLRKKDVNYKFKLSKYNVININVDKSRYKVYKYYKENID